MPRPAPELLEVVVKQREGNQNWRAKYIVATKVTRQDKVNQTTHREGTQREEGGVPMTCLGFTLIAVCCSCVSSLLSSANAPTTPCRVVFAPGSARSTP